MDLWNGHVDFYRMGIWICTTVMWIYKMGHVAFELWLGQGNPRRPVHCAGNKTKRRQKWSHENHYIVPVTPKEWAFSKKAPPSRAKGHLFWECPTPSLLHKVKWHAEPKKKSFFPRYLRGKLRGKNEKTMQGILEKWNAHSCVCFILQNVPQIFMLRNVTCKYTRIFCPLLDLLLVSFALPIRVSCYHVGY